MHELPQVDVIILSWNRLEDTLDAIASAISQSGVDHHIYVVDQGSQPANVAQLAAAVAAQPRVLWAQDTSFGAARSRLSGATTTVWCFAVKNSTSATA